MEYHGNKSEGTNARLSVTSQSRAPSDLAPPSDVAFSSHLLTHTLWNLGDWLSTLPILSANTRRCSAALTSSLSDNLYSIPVPLVCPLLLAVTLFVPVVTVIIILHPILESSHFGVRTCSKRARQRM
jgi:hypothetical protein